ncbi:MAG: serine protease [Candidatus Eisenbacteria bacterium]|nr:serine protease [Candidatus Eisenbacteria bacterium]MCC7143154.1 serine protease [Candidatus Eisenbacteria bacterium]
MSPTGTRTGGTGPWSAFRFWLRFYLLLLGLLPFPTWASAEGDGPDLGAALDAIFAQSKRTVVLVVSKRANFPGEVSIGDADGSTTLWANGIVVDGEGRILTCADAAQPGDSLFVVPADGRSRRARFLSQEVKPGISMIRVDDPTGLNPISLRPQDPPLEEGAWMLVFGYDEQARADFRLARVDAIGAQRSGASSRVFRLSLASCSGTCGGLIVDAEGRNRGVAVNVDVWQDDGPMVGGCPTRARQMLDARTIAAMSVEEAAALYGRLRAQESERAGFLGLLVETEAGGIAGSPEQITPGESPVRIAGVLSGSPAERAGVQVGDRIVSLNNEPVRAVEQVTGYVQGSHPGSPVRLGIVRDGESLVLSTKVGDRSSLDWMERQQRLTLSWQKRLRLSLAAQENLLLELERVGSRYR